MARDSYSLQKNKLQKEILRLQKQMQGLDAKRRAPKIASIVKTMREFDITPAEIAAAYNGKARGAATRKTVAKRTAATVAPRYRNPETGATWTGRGRAPRWIADAEAAGKHREQFLIAANKPAKKEQPRRA